VLELVNFISSFSSSCFIYAITLSIRVRVELSFWCFLADQLSSLVSLRVCASLWGFHRFASACELCVRRMSIPIADSCSELCGTR